MFLLLHSFLSSLLSTSLSLSSTSSLGAVTLRVNARQPRGLLDWELQYNLKTSSIPWILRLIQVYDEIWSDLPFNSPSYPSVTLFFQLHGYFLCFITHQVQLVIRHSGSFTGTREAYQFVVSSIKNDCPSPSNYLLPIAAQGRMGLETIYLIYAGILTGLISGQSCAGNHSCYEFLSTVALPCPKLAFHSAPSPPPALTSFPFPLRDVPWAEEGSRVLTKLLPMGLSTQG